MSNLNAYVYLIVAVILGTASNAFAKNAQGFTLLIPSILTAITIVACMFTLSLVMKSISVGVTYASFAGTPPKFKITSAPHKSAVYIIVGWAPTSAFGGLQAITFFTPATFAVVTLITAEAI